MRSNWRVHCLTWAALAGLACPAAAQPSAVTGSNQNNGGAAGTRTSEPPALDRKVGEPEPPANVTVPAYAVVTPIEAPQGFAGPSTVMPAVDPNRDFIPMEDRWRIGFPQWDRYGDGNPPVVDIPWEVGTAVNPFQLNVLKGDYPITGQHTFLQITGTSLTVAEGRKIPLPTSGFESTARPFSEDFFQRPDNGILQQFFKLNIDLFHGDAAFKPKDWSVVVTPIFNINSLGFQEVAQVNPDVRRGTVRNRTWFALEEAFVETKLADLSPEFDFMSLRVGSQFFNSDFRAFIFSDINNAIRLFGTRNGNRDQFNLVFFRQREKDTNSGLNTFEDRRQNVFIANYYRQDFFFPGYTAQVSFHYNNDLPSTRFDKNNFLVRPDPVGVVKPHQVDAAYIGWTGDGHIERFNITHALYYAFGRDSLNQLATTEQDISAMMAALELSYDRDYVRFRIASFYASGDGEVNNGKATGFDTILDNPNFIGGGFSYFQRQNLPLFGVNLKQRQSLVPDLRSSKIQGQSNFVNPGLFLISGGLDIEVTPKFRSINNISYLWFDKTNSLETFLFDGRIDREIGLDLSAGFEYRPLVSNNIILTFGVAGLVPGRGFKDLYSRAQAGRGPTTPIQGFLEAVLQY